MRIVLAIGVAFFASESWAQGEGEPETAFLDDEAAKHGAFVGASLGVFDYEGYASARDRGPASRLFGGFSFDEKWAVEGSFITTATLSDTVAPGAPVTADFGILSIRGLYQGGPFIFGIGYWYGDEHLTEAGLVASRSDSGFSSVVGVEWGQGKLVYRVEWELFDSDWSPDTDTSMLSFGARFHFE